MTFSLRSSHERGKRNLAVYQVPPVPEGWHGRDLVRIVDPVGLAMAWISPAHAGAIVAFAARISVDLPWTSLVQATPDPLSAATLTIEGVPVWQVVPDWSFRQRDPISALVACCDDKFEIYGTCERGEFQLSATVPEQYLHAVGFRISDGLSTTTSPITVSVARTGDSIEVRLMHAVENADLE